MSLRTRVLVGFLAVAAVLLGADVVLASTYHGFLIERVDRQLAQAAGSPTAHEGFGPHGPHHDDGPSPQEQQGAAFTEFYVEQRDASGRVQGYASPGFGEERPGPEIRAQQVSASLAKGRPGDADHEARPAGFEAKASDGTTYRAIAVPSRDGGAVVVAVDLADTSATFDRMVAVEGVATLAVLGALAAVAVWVLRLGIRPLAAMARAADDIAAGDLSRRVEHAEPRTEAGRLGIAFNTMVDQISDAFAERTASEDRLRRFVADASHELRTPLTSIRGYAELWRAGGLRKRAELAEAMRRMEQEAARMGGLVDDMLLLARLDQRRAFERRPVDLGAVVGDAVQDARAVEPDRPIDLDVDAARGEPVVVDGDEDRLRQLAANLLSNARMHTPAGTPVHVSLAVDHDDGKASIVVADDGPGLPPGAAEKVFERFFRGDASRTRASGGSGLGLSIVSALAAAHGGRAWADPHVRRGARFVVELPLASSSASS
jgi:two-component system OmpR family sensor kinase